MGYFLVMGLFLGALYIADISKAYSTWRSYPVVLALQLALGTEDV